jgi:glycosyltransferase involved in cell wall biosynthesis
MSTWFKRQRLEWEDRARYAPLVRNALSRSQLVWASLTGRVHSAQDRVRLIRRLCSAARLATRPDLVRQAMTRIHAQLARLDPAGIDWLEFAPSAAKPLFRTSALLKPYVSEREKGVLYLSFEREWVKLLLHCDPTELARYYLPVLAPSSDPHNLVNYLFPAIFPGPIFTQISHAEEVDILPEVSSRFVVVPLYASSWVNPDLFAPRPWAERDVDLIMVANFARFKRHQALFEAMRQLPGHLRIVLIGQNEEGRTAETIHELARWYGVNGRYQLFSHLPHAEVAQWLCRSKASVILSRREGSCVVVAESLFADTPAAVLENAEIGSRAFLNASTGRLLHDGQPLGPQLLDLIQSAQHFHPRAWALQHIACTQSSRTLNEVIKKTMLSRGQEWTQDLAPMHWSADPRLMYAADRERLRPAYEDLRCRFGLDLTPALGEKPG